MLKTQILEGRTHNSQVQRTHYVCKGTCPFLRRPPGHPYPGMCMLNRRSLEWWGVYKYKKALC